MHNCGNTDLAGDLHQDADFWQGYNFSLHLSDDLKKFHNFTNFYFCDVTLNHSMIMVIVVVMVTVII